MRFTSDRIGWCFFFGDLSCGHTHTTPVATVATTSTKTRSLLSGRSTFSLHDKIHTWPTHTWSGGDFSAEDESCMLSEMSEMSEMSTATHQSATIPSSSSSSSRAHHCCSKRDKNAVLQLETQWWRHAHCEAYKSDRPLPDNKLSRWKQEHTGESGAPLRREGEMTRLLPNRVASETLLWGHAQWGWMA